MAQSRTGPNQAFAVFVHGQPLKQEFFAQIV
jgi:hypothetical protein